MMTSSGYLRGKGEDLVLQGQPLSRSEAQHLYARQVRLLYDQAPTALAATMLSALLLTSFEWRLIEPFLLGAWFACITLLTLVCYGLVLAYRRSPPAQCEASRWAGWFVAGSASLGLAWGAAGVLLFPAAYLEHQVFLALLVGALGAGTVATHTALLRAALAFIVPALSPLVLRFLFQGDELHMAMGAMGLFFMGLLVISAKRMHGAVVTSLKLGVQNSDLVRHLRASKRKANTLVQVLRAEIDERKQAERKLRTSEGELSAILDNMQDTFYRVDNSRQLTWLSPSVERLLGYAPSEAVGMPFAGLFADGLDHERLLSELKTSQGSVNGYQAVLRRRDGSGVWASINAQYHYDENGRVLGVEGTTREITKRKRAEEALFQEKERAQITLRAIGDGVITTDVNGLVEFLNPVAEQLTGWSCDKARGLPLLRVFNVVDEHSRQSIADPVADSLAEGRTVRLSSHILLIHRYGEMEFAAEVIGSPIRDSERVVIGAVVVFHDVTELQSLARQMSYQATHDDLTGLINRREFEVRLEHLLAAAHGEAKEHALCYMDLDQFKVVNDTCGHDAGDQLLKELAMQLQRKIRDADTLARLGGDEFGLLLESCAVRKAQDIADTLRQVVKDFRFSWQDKVFEVGVSIGVVPITGESGGISEVLSAADSACYVAKDQGRNRIHLYQPDDSAVAQRHGEMQWVHRINKALAEDRLCLYSQTIISLAAEHGDHRHYEILLRMIDEYGELVMPAEFIPAAERYCLMPAVDRWVVRKTLLAIKDLAPAAGTPDVYAINLSGQSLTDTGFLDFVTDVLSETGVAPNLICFEITETAAIGNLMHAKHFISVLKGMGCRFALDDFGSGLCSFAYLKHLDVDYLKLDGSFVKDIAADPVDRGMVEAINQIGHVMGMKTIAEFVEQDSILDELRKIGVDYAQGYGISRPRPLARNFQHPPR